VPGQYGSLVNEAARRHGVDPALVAGVIEAESGFNARAVSPAGAQGLMQLMPGTARGLGVTDALDPTQNVMGGAKLLRQLLDRYKGDTRLALAAYNAGPGAVDKYGGVPPYAETQRYVPKVLAAVERYRQGKAGMAPIE
jgi:soluble lytic murein transglycosylase-like protein